MQMLADIAAVCCVILLLSIVALWWNMRKTRPAATTQRKPVRSERRQHPRMDLAAGMVALNQTVRERSRGQGLKKEGARASGETSALRRRSDRAYFNADMGDLRDPDVGIAPAGGVLRPTGSLSRPEYR